MLCKSALRLQVILPAALLLLATMFHSDQACAFDPCRRKEIEQSSAQSAQVQQHLRRAQEQGVRALPDYFQSHRCVLSTQKDDGGRGTVTLSLLDHGSWVEKPPDSITPYFELTLPARDTLICNQSLARVFGVAAFPVVRLAVLHASEDQQDLFVRVQDLNAISPHMSTQPIATQVVKSVDLKAGVIINNFNLPIDVAGAKALLIQCAN